MNIILFSKDRAAQLELLLHSMEQHWAEAFAHQIKVLYRTSAPEFDAGYEILQDTYPELKWVKEGTGVNPAQFKLELLALIEEHQYTIFFVDDLVFLRDFRMDDPEVRAFQLNPAVLTLSLRLHPHLKYCYTANVPMRSPGSTLWEWRGKDGDFGYPMSLDGHLFRTADLRPLLVNLPYYNPNSLEGILAQFPLAAPLMSCYSAAKIVNNPCNKVQTNNPNRHGNLSPQDINARFLAQERLDLTPFTGLQTTACHQELPLTWVKI